MPLSGRAWNLPVGQAGAVPGPAPASGPALRPAGSSLRPPVASMALAACNRDSNLIEAQAERASIPRADSESAESAPAGLPPCRRGLLFKAQRPSIGDLSLRQFTGRFVTRPKSESACSGPGMRAARQLWRLLVAPRYRQLSGLSIAQMCGYAVATPARMESVPFASCCQ